MNSYGKDRKAFGKPINSFEQMQRYIAASYAQYMAGRVYTYAVANSLNLDAAGNALDSDGVKLFCSTMGKEVANRAIQASAGASDLSSALTGCRCWEATATRATSTWSGCGATPSCCWKSAAEPLRRITRTWCEIWRAWKRWRESEGVGEWGFTLAAPATRIPQ